MFRSGSPFFLCQLVLLAAVCFVFGCAADQKTVGQILPSDQRVSIDRIDHGAWDVLLKKYVDNAGMVDYTRWKQSAEDMNALDQYLANMAQAGMDLEAGKGAQLAFWINAYNALTVDGILEKYPTSSIRNHTAKVVGFNIWKDWKLTVGEKPYSLEEIEHEILRKIGEPRIHFAIVCAARGCPRLLNQAYTADRLEEQLVSGARAFFADRNKFRYDVSKNQLYLSQILNWFGEDFGKTQAEQLRAVAPYFPDRESAQLATSGGAGVSYVDYDWALNDQRTAVGTGQQ